jgi:hypothetical protein
VQASSANVCIVTPQRSSEAIDGPDTQQQAAVIVIAAALLALAQTQVAYPLRQVLDAAVAFCAHKQSAAVWRPLKPEPNSWMSDYVRILRYVATPGKVTIETYQTDFEGRHLSAVITDIDPGNETCEIFDPSAYPRVGAKTIIDWAGKEPNDRPFLDEPGRLRVRWRPGLTDGSLFGEVTIFETSAVSKGPPQRPGLRYSAVNPKH